LAINKSNFLNYRNQVRKSNIWSEEDEHFHMSLIKDIRDLSQKYLIDPNKSFGDVLRKEIDTVKSIIDLGKALRLKIGVSEEAIINNLEVFVPGGIGELNRYKDIILEELNIDDIVFLDKVGEKATLSLTSYPKELGSDLDSVTEVLHVGDFEWSEDGNLKVGERVYVKDEIEVSYEGEDCTAISDGEVVVFWSGSIFDESNEVEEISSDSDSEGIERLHDMKIFYEGMFGSFNEVVVKVDKMISENVLAFKGFQLAVYDKVKLEFRNFQDKVKSLLSKGSFDKDVFYEVNNFYAKFSKRLDRSLQELVRGNILSKNLGLVNSVANKYYSIDIEFMDLVQEGNIGLANAIDTFDASYGKRFSQLAWYSIKRQIIRAITEYFDHMKNVYQYKNNKRKIMLATKDLEKKFELQGIDRAPTIEEVSESSGVRVERIKKMRNLWEFSFVSLDGPRSASVDDGGELHDAVKNHKNTSPHTEVIIDETKRKLYAILEKLPYRERGVIEARYGIGEFKELGARTEEEISEKMGVNRQRVNVYLGRAMESIRRLIRDSDIEIDVSVLEDYVSE
jgi:RNA polymerase sigma factor (sigma-70 family)